MALSVRRFLSGKRSARRHANQTASTLSNVAPVGPRPWLEVQQSIGAHKLTSKKPPFRLLSFKAQGSQAGAIAPKP